MGKRWVWQRNKNRAWFTPAVLWCTYVHVHKLGIHKFKTQTNLRYYCYYPFCRHAVDWLKDAPEILDVCIAQRDFDKAMKLIDDAKCFLKDFSDSHALRDIRARINHRITQLSTVLMKELESSPSGSLRGGPRAARRAVGLLIKLGHATKACELFLLNHQCIIRRDLDDVKNEEGANVLYVGNMSAVFFSGLKNAAIEFQRAFCTNNGSYSSFIVWCMNELQDFCNRCKPVIFTKVPLTTVTDCLVAIRKECSTLATVGLDLTFRMMCNFHVQILEVNCACINNCLPYFIRVRVLHINC